MEKIKIFDNTVDNNEDYRVIEYFEEYTANQCQSINLLYPNKRILTYKVWENIDSGCIVFISGIRKIGKSILLAQICNELIVQNKRSIIIDAQMLEKKFKTYDDYYSLFTRLKANGYEYIFLDEICKVSDASYFGNAIRNFSYSLRFVLTGSSKVGVEKVFSTTGRGVLYTLTDWTYLESLVLNEANNLGNCPYKFEQLSDLAHLVSRESMEDFLYYNGSDNLIAYIKSCIEDTLESNIRRHFPVIDDLKTSEIKAVLELISYSQILELDERLHAITSVKYFSRLHAYITNKLDSISQELNNKYSKNNIENILRDASVFEHNVEAILSSVGKSRISSILRFLVACGLIDVQIKYGKTEESLYELIDKCKFSQLSIVTRHRALTIDIFKRALDLVLQAIDYTLPPVDNIDLMTDDRLNLKGDLLEAYLYSITSNLLPYENVTKFREDLQREVDLLIYKDIKLGLEVKNRRTSNNSRDYIRKQLLLKEELKLKSFAITTTDETLVIHGVKFINIGELIAYLDSLILEIKEDVIVDRLFEMTKINL